MADAEVPAGYGGDLFTNPSIEVKHLTASDGETYKAKFKLMGAIACFGKSTFTDEKVSAEISASDPTIITIHIAGSDTTDVPIFLLLVRDQ